MEPLLLASAYLLYNQYSTLQKGITQHLSRTAPWVDPTDDSGATSRTQEYAEAPVVPSYRPSWMRQFDTTQKKIATELSHPSDTSSEDNKDYIKARDTMGLTAVQTLSSRNAGEGMSLTEPERVRPPHFGGYDGYDTERGRCPVPRYFKFNLGEDLTVDPLNLRDAGMSKGFATGQASRGNTQSNYEIRPDRGIVMGANQMGQVPSKTTWYRGQYDVTGLGRGPGAAQAKPYVTASDDPLDKRFRDEFVPASIHNTGVSRVGNVFKGGSIIDRTVTRHSAVPSADLEKPFEKTKGLSANPVSKLNYMGKNRDYLQQPQFRTVDASKPTMGVSRFTKLHGSNTSLDKDKTKWSYTLSINQAKTLLDETRQEAVSKDKQVLRQDLQALDLTGLERANKGQLAAHNIKPSSDIEYAISNERQLAHIHLNTERLDNKRQVSNQKPVLFSEDERSAYKLDPKYSSERNLEAGPLHSQGLAHRKGASSHTSTSYQYSLKDMKTVNSSLRSTATQEANKLWTGGADRVPIHNLPVQASFQQKNTKVNPKRLVPIMETVNRATSGVAREGISQHPKPKQGGVLQSLNNDKREIQNPNGAGKIKAGPKGALSSSIATPHNDLLLDNDVIADTGGVLGFKTLNRPDPLQLGPARESLQSKQGPVRKRR